MYTRMSYTWIFQTVATSKSTHRCAASASQRPATGKHGLSKHGSSMIPSKHSIPQELHSPCLNLTNYAK